MQTQLHESEQRWLSVRNIVMWQLLVQNGFSPSVLTKLDVQKDAGINPLYEATHGNRAMYRMLPFGLPHEHHAVIHHQVLILRS